MWHAAHAQLDAHKATYFRSTNGVAYRRPVNGVESKYLLTGMLACGVCGSGLFARQHHHGRHQKAPVYLCTYNYQRGPAVCGNALEILRPAPAATDAQTRTLRTELARLETELARLAAAIASGGELIALVTAVQERERRRARLRAELEAITRAATREVVDVDGILGQLRDHLTDWQGMLRQEPPQARRALRALLAGRLIFTPRAGDGQAI